MYGSDQYRITHERAFPGVFDRRRGLDVDDGTLSGRICNVDINFDASWYRARLHLDGHGEGAGQGTRTYHESEGDFRMSFEVTELGPGRRHITGRVPQDPKLPPDPGMQALDLDVSPERLKGRIGMRQFDLAADGDYLAGRYERHGDVTRAFDDEYVIYGRAQLGQMVPADEALVLLLMMTCPSTIEYEGKMVRGFSLVSLPERH
jgi:hypothetical protein